MVIYRNDHRKTYSELLCHNCKTKSHIFQKYGVDNVFKLDEIKKKSKKTSLEKYGVEYPLQSERIKQKFEGTCLKQYGVKNPSQCQEIIDKRTDTFLKRYNKTCPPRTQIRTFFDNIQFDSSWGVIFYKYHKYILQDDIQYEPCKLEYYFNGKKYNYYPDFNVNGKLYEIKGDHLLRQMQKPGSKNYEKYLCMLKNNIIIITNKDISNIKLKLKDYETDTM